MSSTQLLLIAVFIAAMILMSLNYAKRKRKILFMTNEGATELSTRNLTIALNQLILKDSSENQFIINPINSILNSYQLIDRIEIIAAHKIADIIVLNLFSSPQFFGGSEAVKSSALMDEVFAKCNAQKIQCIVCLSYMTDDLLTDTDNELYEVILMSAKRNSTPVIQINMNQQSNYSTISNKLWSLIYNHS